jgi:hypothetical protein
VLEHPLPLRYELSEAHVLYAESELLRREMRVYKLWEAAASLSPYDLAILPSISWLQHPS